LARPLKLVVCLLSVNGVFVELNTTSIWVMSFPTWLLTPVTMFCLVKPLSAETSVDYWLFRH
jgi:hypothetical protein